MQFVFHGISNSHLLFRLAKWPRTKAGENRTGNPNERGKHGPSKPKKKREALIFSVYFHTKPIVRALFFFSYVRENLIEYGSVFGFKIHIIYTESVQTVHRQRKHLKQLALGVFLVES